MHPYQQLDPRFFWATGVAQRGLQAIPELWNPKYAIGPDDAVVTFGSCFAQHFGKSLKRRGYSWLVTEPGHTLLSPESRRKFNYDIFSARTGNIYTASMLQQWLSWALDEKPVPDEAWLSDRRYVDPFRPTIEPGGFANLEELRASQQRVCSAFAEAVERARVFVFTLGLTESWFNAAQGHEYPVCPGTAAGVFDPGLHRFVNQDYSFVRATLVDVIGRMRAINPGIRVLLTVSPVPLTATMSGNHVLVATMESKSILRAVAGSLATELSHVDYFPSYEIISSPAFRGAFFEDNQRTIANAGVDHVMNCFFEGLRRNTEEAPRSDVQYVPADDVSTFKESLDEVGAEEDGVVCEEALLEAFAPKT